MFSFQSMILKVSYTSSQVISNKRFIAKMILIYNIGPVQTYSNILKVVGFCGFQVASSFLGELMEQRGENRMYSIYPESRQKSTKSNLGGGFFLRTEERKITFCFFLEIKNILTDFCKFLLKSLLNSKLNRTFAHKIREPVLTNNPFLMRWKYVIITNVLVFSELCLCVRRANFTQKFNFISFLTFVE